MSDLHTLLLIPSPGDTTLLADEAGGVVPKFCECHTRARGPVVGWFPHGGGEPQHWRRALLLVHNGAPVAMGCDRLLRVDHSFRDWISPTYTNEAALRFARDYAHRHPGSKVVALSADGREVALG